MNTSAEQKCRPGRARLNELGFTLIDADNHYYEPHDAFTRYMEPAWRDRGFRWFTNEAGKRRLLIGDRLLRMIIDPTFERVAKPGALLEVFRIMAPRISASPAGTSNRSGPNIAIARHAWPPWIAKASSVSGCSRPWALSPKS